MLSNLFMAFKLIVTLFKLRLTLCW